MTGNEFFRKITNGEEDILQLLVALLDECDAAYCIIGGLAVNAYAEPVISLDLDLVVIADRIDALCKAAAEKGMKVEEFEHSVNFSISGSDLRIQIQKDPLYQDYISRSVEHDIFGHLMQVASLEDVLQGKIRAYSDEARRKSKRQKDLADIMRLVETHPDLKQKLPPELSAQID